VSLAEGIVGRDMNADFLGDEAAEDGAVDIPPPAVPLPLDVEVELDENELAEPDETDLEPDAVDDVAMNSAGLNIVVPSDPDLESDLELDLDPGFEPEVVTPEDPELKA